MLAALMAQLNVSLGLRSFFLACAVGSFSGCTGDVGTTCFQDDECNDGLLCCHVGSPFNQGTCQTVQGCDDMIMGGGGTGGSAGTAGQGGDAGSGGVGGQGGVAGGAGGGGQGGDAGAGGAGGIAGGGGEGGMSGAGGAAGDAGNGGAGGDATP